MRVRQFFLWDYFYISINFTFLMSRLKCKNVLLVYIMWRSWLTSKLTVQPIFLPSTSPSFIQSLWQKHKTWNIYKYTRLKGIKQECAYYLTCSPTASPLIAWRWQWERSRSPSRSLSRSSSANCRTNEDRQNKTERCKDQKRHGGKTGENGKRNSKWWK